MEGDRSPAVQQGGPGERYDLGISEPLERVFPAAELPEAYGTKRLLLAARDPHWLFAHWDLTDEQLREYNAASRDRHLVLRVFQGPAGDRAVVEQHVHPESRNWFVHVPSGGARYVAQLGYYDRENRWIEISTSPPTVTPRDSVSPDTSVRFETLPVDVPFRKLLEVVKAALLEHVPLMEAIQELRAAGHVDLPKKPVLESPHWTAEQERALAQIINIDEVRRVWLGSLEVTELVRRQLEQEIASQAAAALARGPEMGAAQVGGVSSISSPFGGERRAKGFWFNVNAELIIYGATEPDAALTIGGRTVRLRPDGSFSFRFALPDGEYELPIQAVSADGDDARNARLAFRRQTDYSGEVAAHPQDPALKPPRPDHVA